jgi:hypothetical protein
LVGGKKDIKRRAVSNLRIVFATRAADDAKLMRGIAFKRPLYVLHGSDEVRCYGNIQSLGVSVTAAAQQNEQKAAARALFNRFMQDITTVM